MTSLDYYLWGHTKSLVYETKLQMVTEATGCIFAIVQIRHDGIMLHGETWFSLKQSVNLPTGRWWLL
jgi:extradiol dioxygenase family protein